MSKLVLNTHTLHYQLTGPAGAPVLMFSNSLGTRMAMWEGQLAAFTPQFQVLRYDYRGHGDSTLPAGPHRLADLGQDVLALLDHLGLKRVHFCGLSLGGVVGLWLGIYAAERLQSLTVSNSGAKVGTQEAWLARAEQVRAQGMGEIADSAPERWFTPSFVAAQPQQVALAQSWLSSTAPEGYASCCEVLAYADVRAQIERITAPTLFIAGTADPVTPPEQIQWMQQQVPAAQLVALKASHIANIEASLAFNPSLLAFVQQHD